MVALTAALASLSEATELIARLSVDSVTPVAADTGGQGEGTASRGIGGLSVRDDSGVAFVREISTLARQHIVLGNLEQAVHLMVRALWESPEDPALLVDLAAARIERAVRQGRPEDLPLALSASAKAVALDDDLSAARFNYALVLELLYLRGPARSAWEEYLRVDPSSKWSVEAQQHLDELAAYTSPESWEQVRPRLLTAAARDQREVIDEIVPAQARAVREYIEEEALTAWADAWLDEDYGRAEFHLETARRLAHALAASSGERLPLDAVAAIDTSAGKPERRNQLARGQVDYREGLDALRAFRCSLAEASLQRARAAFSQAESPLQLRAIHRLAVCDYHARRWDNMVHALESIRERADNHNYLDLLGRIDWLEGLVQAKRFPSLALVHYRRAQQVFDRAGDQSSAVFLRLLIAEVLHALGDTHAEWLTRHDVLERFDQMVLSRRSVTCYEFARAAFENDLPRVALIFQDLALELSREQRQIEGTIEALKDRALILAALGRPEADADLSEAEAALATVVDEQFRDNLGTDLVAARGRVMRDRDPQRAIELLTTALETYRAEGTEYLLESLLLERGRARLRAGDQNAAAADFSLALDAFERHRQIIRGAGHRLSFFDRAQEAADELVALELARDRTTQAFDAAERGLARQLLERVAGARTSSSLSTRPLPADSIRQSLPADAAILMYSVLPDRLVSWCIRPNRIAVSQTPVESSRIATQVDDFVGELARGAQKTTASDEQNLRHLAAGLFDRLVRQQLPDLQGVNRLYIVPDKWLHRLPFAALLNECSGRWLIQDMEISMALSGTLVATGLSHPSRKAKYSAHTALLVGDPLIDSVEVTLAELPGAAHEAAAVANYYQHHNLLIGAEATKDRFMELAGRSEIIHFAGHALVNAHAPEYSRLILAPNAAGEPGALFAYELQDIGLERTRVVVLAACATASGSISEGEGPLSLARAFLLRGVPAVVATLWPIRDHDSVELFLALHERLALGIRPSAALRAAQVRLLEHVAGGCRSPAVWAAAQVFGTPD